jgi:alkylhydroperoxidase family enzyme
MARIAYADPDEIDDAELRAALEHAMLHSTPRPEIQAVRARQPEVLRAFLYTWERLFTGGIVDLHVKELCRLRVSQTLACDY